MTTATLAMWAAQLPRRDAAGIAELWNVADIEVCDAAHSVWLRGTQWNDALELQLRKLSGAEIFRAAAAGLLTPIGCLLPTEQLPAGPWRALQAWLEVHLPTAVWPGSIHERLGIQIVRAPTIHATSTTASPLGEASAMLIPLQTFAAYVETAPMVRLRCWTFAVNDQATALVRGTPRPPLPGELLVDHGGVLIPAGYHWTPAIDAVALRRVLDLSEGELALFASDGAWQRIDAELLAAVTRSAVRATVEQFRRREVAR